VAGDEAVRADILERTPMFKGWIAFDAKKTTKARETAQIRMVVTDGKKEK
jgi:hypothetical protein